MNYKLITVTAVSILLSACGALKVRDRNEAEVSRIKTAAIVSFSVIQPEPASLSLDLGSGKLGAGSGGSAIAQYGPHVDQMWTSLRDSLSKRLGWKVTDLHSMVVNDGYKKAYKDTMEGWQNKMPPGKGDTQYLVKDVMDWDSTRILDNDGRDALMEALKVDALVTARVNVFIKANTVLGIGDRYAWSKIAFQIHRKGVKDPVWFDGGVDGDESKDSMGKTGLSGWDKLNAQAVQSAQTAFAKIGSPQN
jgi:hypothetical protein